MMGKPEKLSVTQRVVGRAAETYAHEIPLADQSRAGLGAYFQSYDPLLRAASEMKNEGRFDRSWIPSHFVETVVLHGTVGTGASQQFTILDAALNVIDSEIPREEIPDILRRSHSLGGLFGKIADNPPDDSDHATGIAPSDTVTMAISSDPSLYLVHTEDHIAYSPEGIDLIKSKLHRGMGCPALRQVVELANGKTTIYAASWAANTEEFIKRRFDATQDD